MLLLLPSPDDTLLLGAALGRGLAGAATPVALLLQGPLGSGKTTLVRGLVSALPGAEDAEVSSPSFNLVNIYPTRPQVAHFDLYRLDSAHTLEEFEELLGSAGTLLVAEWIDRVDEKLWPDEALRVEWVAVPSGRALEISAWGKAASGLLTSLAPALNQWQKGFAV
ncbi:MAG: tRNA (adenosine(37)-N6)-threonylcarbamoyltransferase complex ATPase subunit type 1 TsaE [Proteobacteria bacterium]|nr:tRNA (adenosine(37)-N6)-threonylcarbamoyltransferase complex ATPase subunit type 1 TsaE [Pseudomonadota bacterium]